MASTNKTPNYDLPQFVANDKPTWLGDVNDAFSKIDAGMEANKSSGESVVTRVTSLEETSSQHTEQIAEVTQTANTAGQTATAAQTAAETAGRLANQAQADIDAFENSWTFDNSKVVRYSYNDSNIVLQSSGSSQTTAGSVRYAPSNDGSFIKIYGWLDFDWNNQITGEEPGHITFKSLVKNPPSADYNIDCAVLFLGKDDSSNFIYNIGNLIIKANGDVVVDVWLSTVNGKLKFILFPFLLVNKNFGDTNAPVSKMGVYNAAEAMTRMMADNG